MTRIKRLETVVPRQTLKFDYSTPVYSGTPPNNASGSAKALVLGCMDSRYIDVLEQYLLENLGVTNYDLVTLEGASLGANQTGSGGCAFATNNWKEVLDEHIALAILLHRITDIIVIDHLGCYGYSNCSTDSLTNHNSNFSSLLTYLNGSQPALTVSGLIIGNDGCFYSLPSPNNKITQTVCRSIPLGNGAKILILGCIDPRFSALLSSFLVNYKDVQFSYGLFNLAGSSLGVNQSYTTFPFKRSAAQSGNYPTNLIKALGVNWGPTFFDHLDIAVSSNNITEVWVFDHLDCGAYKNIKLANGIASSTDDDPQQHIPELRKLQQYIKVVHPSLAYKGFIMSKEGDVSKVVDDNNGISLEPFKDFGSSNVRAPVSDIINLRAKASADYILKSQTQEASGGFSNRIEVLKLTPVPSQKTILKTKVGQLKSSFLNRNRL